MVKFFKAKTATSDVKKQIEFQISALDLNGAGVAKHHNKPVFIEQALPNETVVAEITEQKAKWAKAKLIEVKQASEHRLTAKCKHAAVCGGCDLQHLAYQQQLAFKQQKITELLARNAQVSHQLPWQAQIVAECYGYRRKARLGVQYNKKQQPMLGYRRKGSNQLCQISQCQILVPELQALVPELAKHLNQLKPLSIGHIELLYVNQAIVFVRQLKSLTEHDKQHWLTFAANFGCKIAIQTDETINWLTEPAYLSYSLPENITIEFALKDFIQVNEQINQQMVQQALNWLEVNAEQRVLDLFCGLGNFSLPLAKRVKSIVGVEGVEAMVERAQQNALNNQLTNCEFYACDLNNDWSGQPWAKYSYDLVLLDPARAGAYQAIEQLIPQKIAKVLYVSCDPATLARDSQLLLDQGYQIEKIGLMDMFSQTKHIETMILFSYQK